MTISHLSLRHLTVVVCLSCVLGLGEPVLGQSDQPRQTVAITYPLDETINVKFRGTTLLPRLTGEAKVRRAGRRGTRVELSLDNLTRASELGGIYTTYLLWAVSPDGRVDSLGEIKRSGSGFINSKLDVTTPLQTFALIVTAEPHFLMKVPSRMVVMENLPPQKIGGSQIATVNVQYIGNSSDYFRDSRVPEIADRDYRDTPVSLLGARQAFNLAKFAGANQDAPAELQQADDDLQAAEKAWRFNQSSTEVDVLARKATSSGAKAEEIALARRAARLRREDIQRRDEALRTRRRRPRKAHSARSTNSAPISIGNSERASWLKETPPMQTSKRASSALKLPVSATSYKLSGLRERRRRSESHVSKARSRPRTHAGKQSNVSNRELRPWPH